MKSRWLLSATTLALIAGSAVLPTGCARNGGLFFRPPNQRPSVDLTAAPVGEADTAWYSYEIQWSGNDADGRVVRFEYVIDPPTAPVADTAWIATTRNHERFYFRSTEAYWEPVHGWRSNGFHTFAIRAVDELGAVSAVVARAFYSYTIAPTVRIVRPEPSSLLSRVLPPNARIEWEGADDDGTASKRPVKYKHRLFRPDDTEFGFSTAQAFPDSLRKFYAARSFAGWDSVGGDTTFVQYSQLPLGVPHLFVVIAIDEAGAYSPGFALQSNMLKFVPASPATLGPRFTLSSPYFTYAYGSGGYFNDPLWWIKIEVPTDVTITIHWAATPLEGGTIEWYRWRLDGDIGDETPRTNEETDWYHWSRKNDQTTHGTFGPFAGGEVHFLYVEVMDDLGLRSLAIVHIEVIAPAFENELLIVDDTRRPPDQLLASGVPRAYGNTPWPAAAELDTFLYARGGVPWRGPQGIAGSLPVSKPGVFAGFSYDTLGTRMGFETASAGVPLSLLGRYRHVLWYTDVTGATSVYDPTSLIDPISTLRWMSSRGRQNTLATYAFAGGEVWLAGGTAAICTLLPFNAVGSRNNDGIYGPAHAPVFSVSAGELAPGRLMWDFAHWRSEMTGSVTFALPVRSAAAVGGWTLPGWNDAGTVSAPDYLRLPAVVRWRSLALGDSLPPTCLGNSARFFLTAPRPPLEYLTLDNVIVEDFDPSPLVEDRRAALDTLYELQGGVLATATTGRRPVTMTYYHGIETPRFVFSGFDLWTWSRQDVVGLVDFVLHDLWGMNRSLAPPAAVRPIATPSRPAPAAPPRGLALPGRGARR